jgi:hypothetical protein
VREGQRRLGLAEQRCGVHWGLEERERPRTERHLHCEAAGQPDLVEDTHHVIFSCVLYDSLRVAHPSLFPPGAEPTLGSFLADPTATHPSFAGAIRRRGRAKRSASLDCLFVAFIFHCLRLWRQGRVGIMHACRVLAGMPVAALAAGRPSLGALVYPMQHCAPFFKGFSKGLVLKNKPLHPSRLFPTSQHSPKQLARAANTPRPNLS